MGFNSVFKGLNFYDNPDGPSKLTKSYSWMHTVCLLSLWHTPEWQKVKVGKERERREKLQNRHYLSVKIAKFSQQFFILRQQVKLWTMFPTSKAQLWEK